MRCSRLALETSGSRMRRKGAAIEVIVKGCPEPWGVWDRLFDWLLSEGKNDPNEAAGVERGDDLEGDDQDER